MNDLRDELGNQVELSFISGIQERVSSCDTEVFRGLDAIMETMRRT